MNRNTRIAALLALGCLGASMASGAPVGSPGQNSNTRSGQVRLARELDNAPSNLKSAMRALWEDHVAWTRLFIVSAANDLSNTGATRTRLLQNQVDIGNAIRPIYGETAGDKLSALLRDHILIAGGLITAAKTNDSNGVAYQKERWFDNGDQIADFLSAANRSNWSRNETRSMMREHLDLTLEEAVAEIKGDFRTSVRKYDEVRSQILKMSDMLSEGIVRQFPEKYSSSEIDPRELTAYSALRIDTGAVLPFSLNQRLSSHGSSVGDRFTANIDTSDYSDYQGMASGAVLEGHVDVARPKEGDSPGVLGLAFDRIRMPDGRTYPIYGTLIGLDTKSVTNENGRLVAKPGAKKDNLKYVGYGAAGGALLAVLTKGNVVTTTLIGGALGYLFGELQKNPEKAQNVTSEAGTKFGVRLTRDLSFRPATADKR